MSVSTLLYSIQEDWSEQTARIEKDWRQVRRVVILVAVAIGPGVFLADRLGKTVAWRSFFAEACSLCLYAAVAVWYGLRPSAPRGHSGRVRGVHSPRSVCSSFESAAGTRTSDKDHPASVWRVALMIYLIGLIVMGGVDFATKRGLDELLVGSPRASDPILWVGALMVAFVPLLGWVAWRFPEMQRNGLSLVCPLSRVGEFILAGLSVGLLIGVHFWLTTKAAGMALDVKPVPYMVWQFFYEVGPQSLTEEFFMRGVVFNELYFGRSWNFWTAALAASSLELLSLLVKQDYSADLIIIVGVIFYTVVSSVASAWLFRWSRSVLPGYVNNVFFGVVSMFR
jgi:hypothetical protein